MTPAEPGFGVYVHWPFCAAKCPYCDFNSHVRLAGIDEPRFAAALKREIAHAAALAPGRRVESVFLGGGTPSLMKPETVAAVIEAVAGAWDMAPMPRSRSKPTRRASRPPASPATARPGSTASRSACSRSTTPS
jgi:coproporphyrinogen III oxidase-like Fe-S oxidoreductase